jgi:hypothetical protein
MSELDSSGLCILALGVSTRKQDRLRLSHMGHAVALHPGGRMSQEFSDFFSMLRCISAPEEPVPSGPPVIALEDAPRPVIALEDAPLVLAQGPASSSVVEDLNPGTGNQGSGSLVGTWNWQGKAESKNLVRSSLDDESWAEWKEVKRTRQDDDSSWAEWKEAKRTRLDDDSSWEEVKSAQLDDDSLLELAIKEAAGRQLAIEDDKSRLDDWRSASGWTTTRPWDDDWRSASGSTAGASASGWQGSWNWQSRKW